MKAEQGDANTHEAHAQSIWQSCGQKTQQARCREWTVCRLLSRKDSATWRELPITEDNRQRMRAAWVILELINKNNPAEALTIRRKYGHRRVLEAGALWKQYENFSVDDLTEHIKSNLSTSAMKMQIIDAHSPYCEWQRKAFGLSKTLDVIAASDAPAEWRELAEQARKLLQKYGDVK